MSSEIATGAEAEGVRINQDTFSQNLFVLESSKDLTVIVGNGAELKCHSIIFAAHSPVLAAMVSSTNGMLESQTGRVEMKENSEEGLGHLFRYLYGFQVLDAGLSSDVSVELFKTAHQYELSPLESHLRELFMKKDKVWFAADDILELYFYVKEMEGLQPFRDHLLRIMTSIPEELKSCERYKELNRDEVHHLLWKLFEAIKGPDEKEAEANDELIEIPTPTPTIAEYRPSAPNVFEFGRGRPRPRPPFRPFMELSIRHDNGHN